MGVKVYESFETLPEVMYRNKRCKVLGRKPWPDRNSGMKNGTYYHLAYLTPSGHKTNYYDIHQDEVTPIAGQPLPEPEEETTMVSQGMSAVVVRHPAFKG